MMGASGKNLPLGQTDPIDIPRGLTPDKHWRMNRQRKKCYRHKDVFLNLEKNEKIGHTKADIF